MMTRPGDVHESLGQALVYWLWAFLLFIAGLEADSNAMRVPDRFFPALARIVLTGVAAAALLICTMELWWKVRTLIQRDGGHA